MSFAWEKAGTFRTPEDAELWCRRQGIAVSESKLVPMGDGQVELSIRSDALGDDDRQQRPRW